MSAAPAQPIFLAVTVETGGEPQERLIALDTIESVSLARRDERGDVLHLKVRDTGRLVVRGETARPLWERLRAFNEATWRDLALASGPRTPRACRTPGCERLASGPAELQPGDAAGGDRVSRRTQLEAQGLCFACADQIAQGPPLGEHVPMIDVCARCGARVSLANNTPCAWRPPRRAMRAATPRRAAMGGATHQGE